MLEGQTQLLLLDSSRLNQLDLMSPEEMSSQLEGKSPEEKSSQLDCHSQLLLLDSSRLNQLDLMSPEEMSFQLEEGQSPEENSSLLEGHSQLEDSSDLANFLALGLAKMAVTRREIIKIFLIIFSE